MTGTSAKMTQSRPPSSLPADRREWTLSHALRRQADAQPHWPFVRDELGAELTYGELLVRVERFAAGLSGLGVERGDRVVLMMDNSLEMLIAWFAINHLAAIEVPMNTANRGNSLEHVLRNSAANLVIADAGYIPVITAAAIDLPDLHTLVVNGDCNRELPWRVISIETIAASGAPATTVDVDYRDRGAIIYTSGTTGPAKGVVMSHAQMHLFARHVVEQLDLVPHDVYLVCLPLFHANAQFMQVYAAVLAGSTIVIAPRFSASTWIRQVSDSGATVSSLLGVMAQFIYNQPAGPSDREHQLRRMVTIPMPAAIAHDFERRFGVTCIEAYGMTEVCLPIYRPKGESLRPGSCGKVLSNWFEVELLDPDTSEPVEQGQVGEIAVRPIYPYTTFLEYHGMPERTVEAWRHLWFHTGDAGRRDADGYYYFVDRINDRIRRRGENVTAYDIESALLEHPDVFEAAVIAVPASTGEDDIKAFVVCPAGVTIDPVALIDHCLPRMAYFAVPRYLEFIDELPKTSNGKVLKRELRCRAVTEKQWDREAAGYIVTRRGHERPRQP